ncbi:hypothetical protein D7X74_18520 [Corallococcus sp. CA047B]|uniref:hypothetical protein n=1 Tax=Corallococcus sp. CA047B TaxID=2316729 RepID=UPI000EA0EE26|nr:hypothetical protein [Corallococcus sp. CA047B]RKH15380.1 hypothetical protein D7X74_18520 [Corallococcus sp. CA047B]
MRSCIIALGLLTLLGSSRAGAAGNKAVAIIWKGAKTQADAEAKMVSWGDLGKVLEKTGLKLKDDQPKLVQSKTVPGLKPGFWVWLLGVCAPDEATPIVEHFKLLSPETYSREVKVPAKKQSCPQREGAALEAREESFKLPSGETLRVFTREEREEDAEEEEGKWNHGSLTRYHFVLFGKDGEVLGATDAVGEEDVDKSAGDGPTAYRCDVTSLEASKEGTFILTRSCHARAGECGALMSADEVVTVKVNGSAVSASAPKRQNPQYAECD